MRNSQLIMMHRYHQQLEYIRDRPGQVTVAQFLTEWEPNGAIAWLAFAKAGLVCIDKYGRIGLTDAGRIPSLKHID